MAEFQVTLRYPTDALVKVMEKHHGIHNVAVTHKHDVSGLVTFLIDAVGGRLLNVKDANLDDDTALVTLSIGDYGEGWHQKAEKEIRQLQEHIRSAQND
ncbi:MAG: hypothetical protein GWN84_18940 [Gammaproteobacteria bacterium]|nr:hypothetical protein [Gammaproteobacteria bacterium]NIR84903.1 hypothetical protein [Gammaproteobacteria bacterium]NIR91752.1 hypothetical protein [Gammaproteobacteria bacterium]NIU05950.1 hypothetical protein [Gammaproteobacteria bacterium]NIV52997.1 hypothetical protein [Gammaproteobacteria bacterium]